MQEQPLAATPSSAALRQLWDSGRRGDALRAALASWDEVLAADEDFQWLEAALRAAGLPVESAALQVRTTRRAGNDRRAWEALVESVLHSGDPWWAAELLAECGTDTRELRRLRVEIDLALGDASASIASWLATYRDEAAVDTAVGWYIASGRVDEAERLLAEVDGLPLWRARLALWRGQTREALTLLRDLPTSAETLCISGAASVLDGRLEEAEKILLTLVDGDVQAEAWSWLATILRKQGRYEEAKRAADSANLATPAFAIAPRLEREMASEYESVGAYQASRSPITWLQRRLGYSQERSIGDLEYAPLLYALGLKPRDPLGMLETAVERLGGNRTPHPTTCAADVLRSLRLPIDPRHLGAIIQLVLWTRGADAVRALYREYAARVDSHPLFRIYEGEIELWMGAYASAEKIFRAIVARDPKVKWAWIGLGASVMLQGDLIEAQKLWAKGVEVSGFAGPTLYVYRGECHRLQGEPEKARQDLEYAVQQKPQRLSAHINLALLDGSAAALQNAEQKCRDFAPLLMDELSGTAAEKLEQVLAAMRGNRSSSPWQICYHMWGRAWRRGV